jgi:hypothetical protein
LANVMSEGAGATVDLQNVNLTNMATAVFVVRK